jgi:superoxide oxidase
MSAAGATAMMYSTLIDDLQAEIASDHRYDMTSMILHWLTVLLLAAMFWTAHAHEAAQDGVAAARMLLVHRSLGIIVWFVTVVRLSWKGMFGTAPALPSSMMAAQRIAAWSVQAMLYALLLLMPITGLLQSVLRGKAFPLLFGEFPAMADRNKAAVQFFHEVHEKGATALLVLIGLHVLAGLYHGLVRRDGVLDAMLPAAPTKH